MAKDPVRCAQVVTRAVNLIYVLSALIYPFMPASSESILAQLNVPARVVPTALSIDILAGHVIGIPQHLFKKIEDDMAEKWRFQFRGSEQAEPTTDSPEATLGLSKRKAAAAKKAAAKERVLSDGPKSPEILALESRVAEQGLLVRSLKGRTPRTNELDAQIKAAIDELKRLKVELEIIHK
jgi:methionyl-tRNA synthetase